MAVFWESLVFSQNTKVSRARHTWPLDLTSCWLRATQLLHTINIASSCLALTGFPTVGNSSSTKCFLRVSQRKKLNQKTGVQVASQGNTSTRSHLVKIEKPLSGEEALCPECQRVSLRKCLWSLWIYPWNLSPVILLQFGLQFYCSVQTKSKI